MFINIYV